MAISFGRRDFLKASAALAGTTATGGFVCIGSASAAPIEVPVVDRLAIRVLIDSAYDNAFTAKQLNGVTIQPGPRNAVPDLRRVWHNRRQIPEVGAECPNGARSALCGGRSVMSVPCTLRTA